MKPKFALACLALTVLSGCVSTPTLKATDCPTANWETIGHTDGTLGFNAQKITHYQKICQGKAKPDRALWEKGRQAGLATYCTKTNAYNLGRTGRTLNAVCEHDLEELHRANMMGLEQYETSERIRRQSYYDYYHHPFWLPFWWF